MALATSLAAKPPGSDIEQVLNVVHTAHKALREGHATEYQWSVLSGCLDVALAIERQGVVRGLQEHLASAQSALQNIYQRATAGAGWQSTSMHYFELDAVRTFVDLHAFQLKQLGRAEYLRAITSAQGAVRSRGERATVVREAAE
jgi:hypothetical protein